MIGLILAWVLSLECPTDTAWIERSGDSYRAACGDEDGNALSYPLLVPDTGIVYYLVATSEK